MTTKDAGTMPCNVQDRETSSTLMLFCSHRLLSNSGFYFIRFPYRNFRVMSTHSSASSPSDRPKTIVVVGGGGVGSIFARQLSAKLDPSKHNLVLVDSRPYALWLIAACRMLVDPKSHLEDKILVPYDEVFNKGPGTFKQGKVIAIHTNGLKEGASSAENEIELDNGERLSFDVLVLATGSRYSVLNPVSFPDDPTECLNHVKRWRERFDDAGNVCLIGGGPVAIGMCPIREKAGVLTERALQNSLGS